MVSTGYHQSQGCATTPDSKLQELSSTFLWRSRAFAGWPAAYRHFAWCSRDGLMVGPVPNRTLLEPQCSLGAQVPGVPPMAGVPHVWTMNPAGRFACILALLLITSTTKAQNSRAIYLALCVYEISKCLMTGKSPKTSNHVYGELGS